MLDVDHFKRINDTRGHGTGDVVLQTLARLWSRELRSSDMLARLGGEEFCVVLPRTGAEAARRIAEKLRAVIAAVPVETDPDSSGGDDIAVTVSVGVSTAADPASANIETLLEQADAALYRAKNNGRNQVAACDSNLSS
jgi:diguanylate cyclase (GGDEF)-like protein